MLKLGLLAALRKPPKTPSGGRHIADFPWPDLSFCPNDFAKIVCALLDRNARPQSLIELSARTKLDESQITQAFAEVANIFPDAFLLDGKAIGDIKNLAEFKYDTIEYSPEVRGWTQSGLIKFNEIRNHADISAPALEVLRLTGIRANCPDLNFCPNDFAKILIGLLDKKNASPQLLHELCFRTKLDKSEIDRALTEVAKHFPNDFVLTSKDHGKSLGEIENLADFEYFIIGFSVETRKAIKDPESTKLLEMIRHSDLKPEHLKKIKSRRSLKRLVKRSINRNS